MNCPMRFHCSITHTAYLSRSSGTTAIPSTPSTSPIRGMGAPNASPPQRYKVPFARRKWIYTNRKPVKRFWDKLKSKSLSLYPAIRKPRLALSISYDSQRRLIGSSDETL